MTEKIKVNVTFSESFNDVMILMNSKLLEKIEENEHFFEEMGQKLDVDFREI